MPDLHISSITTTITSIGNVNSSQQPKAFLRCVLLVPRLGTEETLPVTDDTTDRPSSSQLSATLNLFFGSNPSRISQKTTAPQHLVRHSLFVEDLHRASPSVRWEKSPRDGDSPGSLGPPDPRPTNYGVCTWVNLALEQAFAALWAWRFVVILTLEAVVA
jgi:hypothetical protein